MNSAADIRKIALSLPGVSEIDHFSRPAFRTAKRIFAVIRPDGLFLHLPEERKEFLFEAEPRTFVKYMWGKTANVIVQPARVSRKELEALIREAWAFNLPAPPKTKKTATPQPSKAKTARSVERPAVPRRHRPCA
ncbi:MAG: MmcQ/YjbR family DNA-binding protein [Alphaproteobacteria bacterium]|nr:MmcQ/YjbR family DNA-binding protein [Alphaproteobacteria bacterium]